jgi:hypothetical protein
MALHWSVGRRARIASSSFARVASTLSQFRSRALNYAFDCGQAHLLI